MSTGNLAIESPSDHYGLLHPDQHGTVVIWERQAANNRWRKLDGDSAISTDAILHGLAGQTDAFISVNQFHGWRLQRLLKSLRSNFVDLDLWRPATHQDLEDALELLRERAMPPPSAAIFSGRGLHLYWLTTHTPANALPVWQAVEDALIGALSDLHADRAARDCTRVLRLAGSINGKCGAEVRGLVFNRTPWTLHQLADEVLGPRPPKPAPGHASAVRSLEAARIKRHKGRLAATNLRRWHLVLQDLHLIGRHHGEIQEGYRNEFLFLSSVALSWFAAPDSIAAEVADMANLYCPSLPSDEVTTAAAQSVIRASKAAEGVRNEHDGATCDPRYRFRRTTLWERLEGIAEPLLNQLRAILPDNVRAGHELKRQRGRDRVAEGRHQSHNPGRRIDAGSATQQRPWEALGVSRATYYRQRR